MCTAAVIEHVRREVSRRGFMGAVAGCAAAAVSSEAPAARQAVRMPKGFRRVVDLTHTFTPQLPVFPAYKPMQIRPRFSIAGDGFAANEVTFDEHTGTHVDSPAHFVDGGATGDRIAPTQLIAPLAVISIADRVAKNPDTTVTVDDLLAWEKRHGRLPAGAFVAMNSGWDTRASDTARFLNQDAQGIMRTPGFSDEAAMFLVKQRDISGVGVDTLSLDPGNAARFFAHLAILGAGKYGVELLANLGDAPPSGATVIVGAMKHQGTGGPARVLALV